MALSALVGYSDSDSEDSGHEDNLDAQKKPGISTKDLLGVKRTKETATRKGTVQISLPQIKVGLKQKPFTCI